MMRSKLLALVGALGPLTAALMVAPARPAAASTSIKGSGSSFAAIELQQWTSDVAAPPYNLDVNYTGTSSGQGRSNFYDKTVDFAVTDIRYNKFDANTPDASTFIYVPVTAGGISFMYNLKAHGFSTNNPINLSSDSVCGIFTAHITMWNDPRIAVDNPGVNLPNIPIVPLVRNDPAGTNYVMEEYCIALDNNEYKDWAQHVSNATATDYPDEPTSQWPILTPINGATGSENAADVVANGNDDGGITAVETGYALQRGFPVASVKNDKGAYLQPTDTAVATALSYANQQPDGTHNLVFTPGDPKAYNPSTYSYLLIHVGSAIDPAVGATVTAFANYSLTIGQAGADRIGYASIGRNLIEFGLDRLKVVPGWVDATANEKAAIPAQQQVAQHGTTASPTGGSSVSGGTSSSGGSGNSGNGTSSSGASSTSTPGSTATSAAPGSTGAHSTGAQGSSTFGASSGTGSSASSSGSGSSGSTASGGAGLADPSVSLDPSSGALGQTGVRSDLVAGLGLALLLGGEAWRRRARRTRGARQL